MKRSNEPLFWLLFGAGGMLAALVGAGLVLVTGLLGPLGLIVPARTLDYAHVLALAGHPLGKIAIFGVVALLLWHGVHRMGEVLHDAAHLRAAIPLRLVALAATLACAGVLLAI